MGIIHHHVVIATTDIQENILKIKAWIKNLPSEKQKCICNAKSGVNGYHTFILVPDGSKEGWKSSEDGDQFRSEFIKYLNSFEYEDGSSNVSWVELSYGECGQIIEQGNNINQYD